MLQPQCCGILLLAAAGNCYQEPAVSACTCCQKAGVVRNPRQLWKPSAVSCDAVAQTATVRGKQTAGSLALPPNPPGEEIRSPDRIRSQLSAGLRDTNLRSSGAILHHLRAAAMVSQYPAELPGSTAAVLHSDVNKLDGEPEQTSVPAPVAAVTNVDALTLNSEPGVPNIKLPDTQKKPKEKGVSYFSLYRQVTHCV